MKAASRPADLWLAEQIEAIAVAIAMALVLKFFVVEAYQIPTGSMQPTVLGDAESGIQDRVLADKLCLLLRAPRRWEVMIFRLPYDERALYVKRIVGLPGEVLEVQGGDVWIDGKIARKPDHVNESVLRNLFPVVDGGIDIRRAFDSTGAGVEVHERSASFAPGAPGQLRLHHDVLDEYLHGYDPDWHIRPIPHAENNAVADVDVALDATLAAAGSALRVSLQSDEGELQVRLSASGGGGARVVFQPAGGGPERVLLDDPARELPAGRAARVLVRNVDRRVIVRVDGEDWLRADDDSPTPRPAHPVRSLVTLGIDGGGNVSDLVLRRDTFYLRRDPLSKWNIPGDSCFALGDNTQASLDSRSWELKTYVLKDDRRITGFWFPELRPGSGPTDANPKWLPGDTIEFADVHGDVFRFARADVVSESLQPAPFIPENNLLGKAIAVFWPVYHPFRWKLIR